MLLHFALASACIYMCTRGLVSVCELDFCVFGVHVLERVRFHGRVRDMSARVCASLYVCTCCVYYMRMIPK